ncbi:MAG TPA: sialidase family protein [Vicinamibacterales bacterium]|nr:sialidase family protein [Vicinamibacterales bacterium]
MRAPLILTAGVLMSALTIPLSSRQASIAWPLTVEQVPSPAAAESAQPQMSASSRGVLLSWIERAGAHATLKFSERAAGRWSEPRTVASGADWFVNWADVPSVVRLGDGTLAAHWLQKSGADTYAYDVRLAYSKDDGKTWSASFLPHHDGTRTEHGFASLFHMAGGGLGAVWLDGRAMARPEGQKPGASDHGHGEMSLRFAAFDGNWKQVADEPIDPRVCECCPTAVAMTSDGPIAAYRNRGSDEDRDIYITRRENGTWTAPTAVHRDGWKIAACPVNGPALSARGRDVAIAWFMAKDDQPRVFVAFSSDAGRTFAAPTRVDDVSTLGRVDVELLPDGAAAVSYIEFAEKRAQFRVRRIDRTGARSAPITISALDSGRASGYPRMARDGAALVFAWTARDVSTRVHTAVARLPGSPAAGRQ